MTGFTIAPAQLAALFMQSISFGVHLVTFGVCMYTWFCRSGSSGPSTHASLRWMVIAIAFFVVGTCDVSFNFYHNLLAFVKYKGPGDANAEFSDASNWVNVIRSVWLYIGATLSDVVMIYRCWIVYARNRYRLLVTIPPLVLWLASVACSVAIVYYLAASHAATTIPEIPKLQPFIYAFYITSLILNLFTTACIIIRLWGIHRSTATAFTPSSRVRSRHINLANVTLIIVESALLYTATVVFSVIFEIAKTNAYYGITDISLEVAGISFDLIIIRIWQGTSTEQTQAFTQTRTAPRTFKPAAKITSHTAPGLVGQGPLELQVIASPADVATCESKTDTLLDV